MDLNRYSKSAFDSLSSDSVELTRRIEELQDEVQTELHAVVSGALSRFIERLNASGHALRMESHSKPGELDYEDPQRGFYVCCDTIISAGFRDS